jgi:hypothetical protein
MSTSSWILSPNSYPIRIQDTTSIVNNNYVYVFGGATPPDTNFVFTDLVYYAKLNSDGSLGSWNATTPLPTKIAYHTTVINNNYVYVLFGLSQSNPVSNKSIYYAKLNSDGSVGEWTESIYSLPTFVIADATAIVNNNYVYVIGGNSLNTVYYAQPNNDGSISSWIQTTSLPIIITNATSVVINNYIYIIGGTGIINGLRNGLNTVYYAKINNDGSVGEWTQSSYTLPTNIIDATSIVTSNYVYVICGNDDYEYPALNTVYYTTINGDGLIGPWKNSSISSFPNKIHRHASISPFPNQIHRHTSVIHNNYIYVIGGSDYDSTLNSVYYIEYYDNNFVFDIWTLSPEPFPIYITHTSSIVNNNYVYVIGGSSIDIINSYSNRVYYAPLNDDGSVGSWILSTSTLPTDFAYHSSVVNNNYAYILGGSSYLSISVLYAKLNDDGSVGSWIQTTGLPRSCELSTSFVNNNYVYVIGGLNGENVLNTVYYAKLNNDGSVGSWNTSTFPKSLYSATSIVNNNYVYVIGGTDNINVFNTVYYAKLNNDGSVGSWNTPIYNFPISLYGATSIVNNNYIYVIGGTNNNTTLNTVYYAPMYADGSIGALSVSSISYFPFLSYYHTSVVNNNYIYIIGGYNNTQLNKVYYVEAPVTVAQQSTTLLYSTKINLAIGNTEIFNGYFTVFKAHPSDTQGVVTHFYDVSNGVVDIYTNNNFASEDSLYLINTNQFSYNGTNISSFPYLYDMCNNSVFYNLYQNGNRTKPDNRGWINSLDINGKVLQTNPVIITNNLISESYLLYSTQINLTNNTKIFDGIFSMLPANPSENIYGLVTHFYDVTDLSHDDLTDLSHGDIYKNNGGDHIYFINTNGFSSGGTNITSFPYFKKLYSDSKFYNLFNDVSGGVNILDASRSILDTVEVNFTNTLISEPPPPTTLWYSTKIKLMNNDEIFNGYFSVLQTNPVDTQGVVTHFYDLTNYGVDIYTNNEFDGADSIFLINSAKFSSGGTNIRSFPYFDIFNTNYAYYKLYRSGTDKVNILDITGTVLQTGGVTFVNTRISGPPPPPPPTILWYSIKINLLNNTEIFNGYFSVLQANPFDTSGVVTHFYDLTNYGVDIYANNGQDSLFLINTNRFSSSGTVISSFSYFNKLYPNSEFYKLYCSGTDNVNILTISGSVLQTVEVIFTITSISGPPPPPPPVLKNSLFTNNATVYYKKNSLAPCGVGTVINSRIKSKET